jgi:CubicO group peptidase (beta-lactamase class C family)
MTIFPGVAWEITDAKAAGFDPKRFAEIGPWLVEEAENREDSRYRVAIVRGGALVGEWNSGVNADARLRLASATKSIFACVLGIAVAEGRIPSPDTPAVDLYPELMDVPAGTGPKEGRYAYPANRGITLRHLICNVSGYMKPGEEPGKVFNYQTYGMNILTHAIAAAYGLYDSAEPERLPGLRPLMDERIGLAIGASWDYYRANFALPSAARIGIFGYYHGVSSTARDMARLGWLWRNRGRWGEQQVIPPGWVAECTAVAPDIRANCPQEEWVYGHGFWTNAAGRLWPNLPADSFAASGAGRQHIWVCPSLDLVVAQSPGLLEEQSELGQGLLGKVVAALDR